MASLEDSLSFGTPCFRTPGTDPVTLPKKDRPATTTCCRSTAALGVSHPLDGLGSEPLGKLLHSQPDRIRIVSGSGFDSRRALDTGPRNPHCCGFSLVDCSRTLSGHPPRGRPIFQDIPPKRDRWSLHLREAPPKRNHRSERSCHVAFPDARAPFEERHSLPAVLCHHST